MLDWFPFAIKNPAPTRLWGTYTGGPMKGGLHTTETPSFSPHSTSYGGWHNNYPHFTVVLLKDRKTVQIYQHIPLSRAARALKNAAGGVQTNDDSAIQIEIVWYSTDSPNMPRVLLDTVRSLMHWLSHECGIQLVAPKNFKPYPDSYGAGNGVRMSNKEWDAFNGWCGHQHVPENDHGDPGKIDIAYLLADPQEVEVPAPTEITAVVDDPTSNGYWMVEFQGGVHARDGALFFGSLLNLSADKRQMDPGEGIVGLVPKLNADKTKVVGYKLVTNKGDGYDFAA